MPKLIVIAERVDDVVIVTPRSPHAARGVIGNHITVHSPVRDHPKFSALLDEVEPCFATTHLAGAVEAMRMPYQVEGDE